MAMVERVALLQAVHAHLKDMELDMGKSDFETETWPRKPRWIESHFQQTVQHGVLFSVIVA